MRRFPRLPFAVKFSLAISAIAVGMTTISVSFMYAQLYDLLVRQTAELLKDVGQTSSFLFDAEAQDSLLNLKAAAAARSQPITPEMLAMPPGETTLTLAPDVAEALMASPDFQTLVQIMRRIGEGSRARMLLPQSFYRQPDPKGATNPTTISTYLMVEVAESPDRKVVKFIADGLYERRPNWPGNPIGNLYRIPDEFFATAFEGQAQIAPSFYSDEFGTWLTAVVPLKNRRGEVIATLGLDFDATQEVAQVEQLRWICIGAVLVSLVLSIAVASALARWLAPPIAELRAGAERVSRQDYSTLVTVSSPMELRLLAIAFNGMVQEIRKYAHSLKTQNKALESRVQARTRELRQTLDVLKATQAELMIENALLRTDQWSTKDHYQVGGSLPFDAPTYVVRQADRDLYQALRQGQYGYVLNARQMGKSSLRVQMMKQMQAQGSTCIAIDLSIMGSKDITIEQWYAGLIHVLARELTPLHRAEIREWLRQHHFLSPVQRLQTFVHEVLLEQIKQNLVIFIDEIDSVLALTFSADDFFIWIRDCFNRKADEPNYRRLSFVLLGVATPEQLIQDPYRTPFNIGRAIQLSGFQAHEAYPLLRGLPDALERPQVVLQQVLDWTSGQPFLTQKICQLIRKSDRMIPAGEEQARVEALVRSQLIDHWEAHDTPEHLQTVRNRLLADPQRKQRLLQIYEPLLTGQSILADDSPEQCELLLSGLVVKRDGQLYIANRIYGAVFNANWVARMQQRTAMA